MSREPTCCVPPTHRTTRLPLTTSASSRRVVNRTELLALDGGTFLMGSDGPMAHADDGEGPVRVVEVQPFRIAPTAVTNSEFNRFVSATGYKTEAERFGWSFVFSQFIKIESADDLPASQGAPWWRAMPKASWREPEGPGSDIDDRSDHPVVHVSWNDAIAYCNWTGLRLPTEAEWEFAARGGLEQKLYPWGDELTPGGRHRMNVWQGDFPVRNTAADGYISTAPVTAYEANGFGLSNMTGNVWEWCADWFLNRDSHKFRVGPPRPTHSEGKVLRGGSYLCHESYCNRYRVSARSHNTPDSSTGNASFRCASDLR